MHRTASLSSSTFQLLAFLRTYLYIRRVFCDSETVCASTSKWLRKKKTVNSYLKKLVPQTPTYVPTGGNLSLISLKKTLSLRGLKRKKLVNNLRCLPGSPFFFSSSFSFSPSPPSRVMGSCTVAQCPTLLRPRPKFTVMGHPDLNLPLSLSFLSSLSTHLRIFIPFLQKRLPLQPISPPALFFSHPFILSSLPK